jgi:ABC-2 type transport system ATP-binding protein
MNGMPVIRCAGVSMAYGRKEVVSRVALEVPPGSVYALLGRNGAGKSTLVRGLLGLDRLRSGQAWLFGLDAWRERARIMEQVGVVPETPQVPPRMSAAQASAFCGRLCPAWDQASVDARLRRFDVDPRLAFGHLSRGQQTQAALALALGSRPELLVLDDPTLGLDPVARRDLYRELVEDLGERGTTVFIATHDLAGIEGIADRVGVLHKGRLLVDETMDELKGRFRRIQCGPGFPEAALAAMGPAAFQRGAFGLEATVARFSAQALAEAGLTPGAAAGASLEDIFLATVNGEVQS